MAFFKMMLRIIKGIGFVIILFFISYLITVLIYYSNDKKEKYNEIEILNDKDINITNIYNKEYIQIEINDNGVEEEKVIAYALTYFDKYNKEVYLYDLTNLKILIIGKNEEIIIQKHF